MQQPTAMSQSAFQSTNALGSLVNTFTALTSMSILIDSSAEFNSFYRKRLSIFNDTRDVSCSSASSGEGRAV